MNSRDILFLLDTKYMYADVKKSIFCHANIKNPRSNPRIIRYITKLRGIPFFIIA